MANKMSSSPSEFSSSGRPSENSPLEVNLHFIKFYMEEEVLFKIDSCLVETLSQEPFDELISTFESHGKKLIIAVVKSRDTEKNTTVYKFFYQAFLLNKLLFKVSNREIISRHHPEHRFIAKNPITMLPIIGEVEYYLIARLGDSRFKGMFIGTDYTYVHNESLRGVFEQNTLRQEDIRYEELPPALTDFTRILDLDVNSLDLFARIVENQRDSLLAQVRVPFKTAFMYGILALTTIVVFSCNVVIGGTQYMRSRGDIASDFSGGDLVVIFAMPVVSVLQDYHTASIYRSQQNGPILVTKVCTWVLYLGLLGLTVTTADSSLYHVYATAHLGFSVFYSIFSICLFLAYASHKRLS